ncbi:MAG: hypothetical protein ACRC2H_04470 [Silanimonas sp.]
MFNIESGVPLPKRGTVNRKRKYPFADMKVGDSFKFPKADLSRVGAAARSFRKLGHKDWKFSIRNISHDQSGLWRVR